MVLANWTIKLWNIRRTLHVFTIQTREMVIMHPGLLFPNKSTQNRLLTLKIGTFSLLLILSCVISLVCIIICDVFFILCILVQNYEIWIAFPHSILFECVWFCWIPFRLVFVWLHYISFHSLVWNVWNTSRSNEVKLSAQAMWTKWSEKIEIFKYQKILIPNDSKSERRKLCKFF